MNHHGLLSFFIATPSYGITMSESIPLGSLPKYQDGAGASRFTRDDPLFFGFPSLFIVFPLVHFRFPFSSPSVGLHSIQVVR